MKIFHRDFNQINDYLLNRQKLTILLYDVDKEELVDINLIKNSTTKKALIFLSF